MSDLVLTSSSASTTSAAAVATTTLGQIVEQVRRYLYTGYRVERTRLTTLVNSSATALAFDFATPGVKAGAKVSLDYEDIHVWTASSTSAASSCQRGEYGSTAAGHSAGSIAHINAPFTKFEIFREINNELRDLSSPSKGLFWLNYVDITWNSIYQGYDLGVADLVSIWQVRAKTYSSTRNWPVLSGWELSRGQSTADFASGNALFLYEPAWQGQPVRVFYRTAFTQFPTPPDDSNNVETVTHLPGGAHDILAMGAAIRLAGTREVKRNLTENQGDPRRAAEVPPGASDRAIAGIASQYQRRVVEEAGRLHAAYPERMKRRRSRT